MRQTIDIFENNYLISSSVSSSMKQDNGPEGEDKLEWTRYYKEIGRKKGKNAKYPKHWCSIKNRFESNKKQN